MTTGEDEEISKIPETNYQGSPEVVETANKWLDRCKCYEDRESGDKGFLPQRLLDLRDYIPANVKGPTGGEGTETSEKLVYLVEKTQLHDIPAIDRQYVTLSYCWGAAKREREEHGSHQNLRLREDNIDGLHRGFKVSELPLTLQNAIDFASRLAHGIRYIWIDVLCIIQSGDQQNADWLGQSSEMDQIYGNSFLNISATAAENSDEGMYRWRQPKDLWEKKMKIKLHGIPGIQAGKDRFQVCRVTDATFWDRYVLNAPVNKRGWVLQERLMAPRVLHFCKFQVAWECSCFRATESRPETVSSPYIGSGNIISKTNLKGLLPVPDGEKLRCSRLGVFDPDEHLGDKRYAYEIWKHVVETYSVTALTVPGDKLIALSGIAKRMNEYIESEYIAGMWKDCLASQLLWRVEPIFRDNGFHYLCSRPEAYRAPSFSWASVELEQGQHIAYGEITDKDILIKVVEVAIIRPREDNPYGLVKEGCYLRIEGNLRRIVLEKLPRKTGNLCGWRLATRPSSEKQHINVYLDSPQADADVSGGYTSIYCMPVAKGYRKDPENSQYLFCLLLKEFKDEKWGKGTFKRVGVAKLSAHTDMKAQDQMLEFSDEPEEVPCISRKTMYTIRVI